MHFSIGIDYGTNSVRALLVNCATGEEVGSCVVNYPGGREGVLLDPHDHHLARQHPGDYLFGLEHSVKGALLDARDKPGFSPDLIVGIGVDTTGSSPLPVDADNQALALQDAWKDHPAAQCWLWKDHTSHAEAEAITRMGRGASPPLYRQMRKHVFLRVVLVKDLALPESRAGSF